MADLKMSSNSVHLSSVYPSRYPPKAGVVKMPPQISNVIHAQTSSMMEYACSGPSLSTWEVNPSMSQNITVTCPRSPSILSLRDRILPVRPLGRYPRIFARIYHKIYLITILKLAFRAFHFSALHLRVKQFEWYKNRVGWWNWNNLIMRLCQIRGYKTYCSLGPKWVL